MNMSVFDTSNELDLTRSVNTLITELDHYRKQSEVLQKLNLLHQKMGGVLDLPTMIETYSIWMMEHIEHDLIGYYNHSYQKMHMYCSSHGPQRRQAIRVTEELLRSNPEQESYDQKNNFFVYRVVVGNEECEGTLAFVRKNKGFDFNELEFLKHTFAIITAPIQRALQFEEIFSQARKDSLTGLPNRYVFEERIDAIIEQARRHSHPLTMAAMDLDNFKAVNDTMGHLKGDEVLQQVATVLQEQVRQTDLLVRMGGDEFILILPDTEIREAENLTQRLCKVVNELNVVTSVGKMGISIGLSQWHPDLSKKQWLEQGDDILYKAKADAKTVPPVH